MTKGPIFRLSVSHHDKYPPQSPVANRATHGYAHGMSVVFELYKNLVIDWTGLARDALHVHTGLIVFVLVRLMWRRRGGWMIAWTIALCFALGGEWLDYLGEAPGNEAAANKAHWHDIWNTMLWPTILLFIGRWLVPQPEVMQAAATEPAPTPPSGDNAEQRFEQR